MSTPSTAQAAPIQPAPSNRTHTPVDLSKGERDLLLRALEYFMHAQQIMIQEQWIKMQAAGKARKAREIFDDHKQHHEAAIKSAGDLFDRFRNKDFRRET